MKVTRTIVIEGNPSWVKQTLELSYLHPGEDIRFSWHQSLVETNREVSGENMTDTEYYRTMNRQPGNSIEEHEKVYPEELDREDPN